MITAIALDDEPLALQIVQTFCNRNNEVDLKHTFTEPAAALAYLEEHPVDLIFLDINMPGMSGIEFYKQSGEQAMVIFTTAYSEYAVEGFNLKAVDYLLKPFDEQRFRQAVEKANAQRDMAAGKPKAAADLLIRADYSVRKIPIDTIRYIESLDNYLKIHIENARPVVARMSMKGIIEKLPAEEFMRVHRSYIIPMSRITSVRNKTIYLGETEIPVGFNYTEQVAQLFRKAK